VRETYAVLRKELRSLFVGPIPYLVVAVFTAFAAWWVFWQRAFFLYRQANLDALFNILPMMFVFVVPAIAMRGWSEEIRGETLEPLMTSPVRVRHLVLGKFLAGLSVVALCLVGTLGIAITAGWLGDLDVGAVVGGYVGALFLGGAYLALGLWLSSKTRNQIVAFFAAMVLCFVWTMVDNLGTSEVGGAVGRLLSDLSSAGRFRGIARGVFDVRDVAFFASAIAFFLYLNVESVENKRYA
jgi:ABC-2 type transport system permease protein